MSRPVGIGTAVATRLKQMGAIVFATGWPPHDAEMPWGEQTLGNDLAGDLVVARHDLELSGTPAALIDEVVATHGRIDIVVAVHARSSSQSLAELTVDELQRSWAANVQSVLLLAQRFAAVHQPAPLGSSATGRILWFTSGQHLQPMESELAYSVTKGALHQMTTSVNEALAEHRIIANCVNPGPVDTGYADGELHTHVASMFPDGQWGTPGDVANLVAFLVSDEGAWIRGQVLNSEGGFNRFA